jgi:hypothetical protein
VGVDQSAREPCPQSHVAVKAIAYFDYKADRSASLDGHVFLDGGNVNYAPNVDDFDHRLVAESGRTFARASRRESPRRGTSSIRTVAIRAKP